MEQLTGLGKAIAAADPDKIRLDMTVKNILAYKPLLARIFKEVVSECRDMDFDEIEACIEGDVLVSKVYVDSGITNAGERIDGLNTEAYLNEEGLDRYDILNAIIVYISEKHDSEDTDNELIRMLTNLFDERINVSDKIKNLKSVYGLNVTKEVESEVTDLCTYADAIENKGIEKGIEKGLKALVDSLKVYVSDFDALYMAVIKNETYEKVSREDVMKYYCETETPVNS
jgi:chorismate mutase